jgi:hypothetical protein
MEAATGVMERASKGNVVASQEARNEAIKRASHSVRTGSGWVKRASAAPTQKSVTPVHRSAASGKFKAPKSK